MLPQLFQMFDNIKALRLTKDTSNRSVAMAMISSEGEIMEFRDEGGHRTILNLAAILLLI